MKFAKLRWTMRLRVPRARPGARAAALWCAVSVLSLATACTAADSVAPSACGTSCVSTHLTGANPAREFFVSPTGSPTGDGSFAKPWDLSTALAGPAAVTPGSTIWLREGVYTDGQDFGQGYLSTLVGTPEAPIIVRQRPGERVTLTKFLTIRGADTWFWGFEVVHPAPHVGYAFGINNRGPRTKLINLVVHDASASGILMGAEATDAEVYGSIVYNNGRTDKFDHGLYCQSKSSLALRDNIVFDNWAVGIHCYVEPEHGPEAALQNIHLSGNVAFNNSVWSVPREDILVGGERPAAGITVDSNYTYRSAPSTQSIADMGYDFLANEDIVLTNNHFVGGWLHIGRWTTARVTGNTLFNFTTGPILELLGDPSGHAWSANTMFGDPAALGWRYDGSAVTTFDSWRTLTRLDPGAYAGPVPTGVEVIVRPNRYEDGRANIIVYNWTGQSTLAVDVSGILVHGDRYAVQDAQDFYGPPVTEGIYTGRPLELPIGSIAAPTPLGTSTATAPVTGPTFNVFVLTTPRPRGRECDGGDKTCTTPGSARTGKRGG